MPYDLEHHFVLTNGLQLHVVQCGPVAGPLVILLHGFPEFWYAWRQQIPALAAAGFRVWAPDQRGYNLSDKPCRVRDYAMAALAADIIGLIDAAGRATAAIVGHDWGAAVAWHLAAHFPGRISRVAVLNVPHPRVMARALRHSGRQRRKSWYILFFQLPWLPEALLRFRNWRAARQALRDSSRPGTFSEAALAAYQAAWSQPQALRSMVNWYRAAGRGLAEVGRTGRVAVPVYIIWGRHDAFLEVEMAAQSQAWCDDGQLTYLPASHWVQHEEPALVNDLLLSFLHEPAHG
jgi:pimeloyl-ACP methyl ester carboxylesterase